MQLAAALMREFAAATGLSGASKPERYLWTDAFAVCNYLGLHRRTGKAEYLELALSLVSQVHHVLGRHRGDDARRGWISGLPEEEGERHPTRGGLRIGKPMPERRPTEPFDAHAEWNRDGQYFHYLTQWMHALHRAAETTGQRVFDDWALELAQAAHAAFARRDAGRGSIQLVWKMSIDLRRVLVPSTGQHDALDALTTYHELVGSGPELSREISEAQQIAAAGALETDDALGTGALLLSAYRLAVAMRGPGPDLRPLLQRVLSAARLSLEVCARGDPLSAPAHSRLAFRELGLAIGLHAVGQWRDDGALDRDMRDLLTAILGYLPLAARIDELWSDDGQRRTPSWAAHRHINSVMLATSLLPEGYLGG
jgi:hypothetical protein